MSPNPRNVRRVLVTGALAAGTMLGAAGIASAATGGSTSSGSSASTAPAGAPQGNPATMSHGPGETLLTGSQLTEATTAAEAAVPGATVIRAETNSSGGYPYEVHMAKSDGTDVTVELDSGFKVITTVSGFGAGPAGGRAPGSSAPASSSGSATSSTA